MHLFGMVDFWVCWSSIKTDFLQFFVEFQIVRFKPLDFLRTNLNIPVMMQTKNNRNEEKETEIHERKPIVAKKKVDNQIRFIKKQNCEHRIEAMMLKGEEHLGRCNAMSKGRKTNRVWMKRLFELSCLARSCRDASKICRAQFRF